MTGRAGLLVGILVGAAATSGAFLLCRDCPTTAPSDEIASGRSNASAPPDTASQPALETVAADPAILRGGKSGPTADPAPTPAESEFLRKALAEERRRSLAARIRAEDSGLDVLRRILEERADPAEILGDFDRFASHVRSAKGRVVRFAEPASGGAPIVLRDSEAKGAAILEFGPGRFVLDTNWWGAGTEDTAELEIRGAGRDQTILVPQRNLIMATKRLDHLRIHDLSIETAEGMTLDVRGNAAAIFEDVRFLAWQAAGHAAAVGVSGKGYVGLRRCEFLGGGARQGFGISLRGPAVVLAEDCTFADVMAAVIGGSGTASGSVVRLVNCRFLGSPLADRGGRRGESPELEIHVAGGEAFLGGKDLSEEDRRLRWGVQFAASVEGVVFGPDPARPTLGELLAVLDAVKPDIDGVPLSVSFVSAERFGQPSSYSLAAWDGKSQRPTVYTVRMQGGRAIVTLDPRGGGPSVPEPGELDGVSPLADLLRRAGISGTTEATEIQLQVTLRNDKRDVHAIVTADRRATIVVDAHTAAIR
jgi:hypothetical protein